MVYIKSYFKHSHNLVFLNNTNVIQINLKLNSLINLIVTAEYRLFPKQRVLITNSIFIGDLNIDILRSADNCSEYLKTMYEFNYKSVINIYSRVQDNMGTCIDHTIIKSKTDITN